MTTFAFGGVYLSTLAVPAALCVILGLLYRPWPARAADGTWSAGVWLSAALALCLLQLLPLPGAIVDVLSPHARPVWRGLALDVPRTLPLSIDPGAGAWACLVAACALITFLSARHIFARGGVRRTTRAVATIGLVLAVIGLAQDATAHGLMYWRWSPLDEGAQPFGPFVNRNHFGTWAILAVPLVCGYLAAHSAAHQGSSAPASWRARLSAMVDARTIWLIAGTVLLLVALAVTLSRSAMFGLAAGAAAAFWLRPGGAASGKPGRWIAIGLLLAAAAVLVRVDPASLGARVAASPVSAANRLAIWRDTLPVVRDFWLTGTGAGTYETVMLLYQRAMPEVRFNQAHNHYLQLAAEGGLLLVIPMVLALRAYLREAATLRRDASGIVFVRVGAACGLVAVAAQSVWETGLTTPANAVLAAILAAIVVHAPSRPDRTGDA